MTQRLSTQTALPAMTAPLRPVALRLLPPLIAAAVLCAGCAEAVFERLGLAGLQPLTIAFVVHGSDNDPLWQEIRAGAEDAAQAFDTSVFWQASPDTGERVRMVEDALSQGFDVLVITLSDHLGMERIVREAIVEGAIVYVINAGVQYATAFGAHAFFGMLEMVAGLAAGERLAEAGITRLLCVIHGPTNEALETRCEQAEFRIGEMVRLEVEPGRDAEIEAEITQLLRDDPAIDGVLTHDGAVIAAPAAAVLARFAEEGREIAHAAFGVDEQVLEEIEAGRILFAVDQQPWLQGYLPVAYAQVKRYSARSRGDAVASVLLQWAEGGGILLGPGFVDRRNVDQVRESGAVVEGGWWRGES